MDLGSTTYFDQFEPRTPARLFVGGETHLYLGRQYRLKITLGASESVKLKGGYFYVETKDPADREQVSSLLEDWYQDRAAMKLRERYRSILPKFEHSISRVPPLSIRIMRQRWGSFSRSGCITLNTHLVKAPTACIDYVVAHELVHAVHPDHGKAFFRLLETVIPDWSSRKHKLEQLLS
jgi:predicted metal-dependent hydrolase